MSNWLGTSYPSLPCSLVPLFPCSPFPSLPQAFGTGSDDSSCRLFDMRCYGEANYFGNDKVCLVLRCVEACVVLPRVVRRALEFRPNVDATEMDGDSAVLSIDAYGEGEGEGEGQHRQKAGGETTKLRV